jgi:hypothetical protein
MNPGIVSADRHDRQTEGTGSAQLRKRIAQCGIARKKDAAVIENVAVVTAIGIAARDLFIIYADRKLLTPAMIARIKAQFHSPAERTEVQSDRHYQSTETPGVLGMRSR